MVVKRSKDLQLGLLLSVAAATLATSGCGGSNLMARRCVDGNGLIAEDGRCTDQDRSGPIPPGGGYPYRWYYGGPVGYVPVGQQASGGSYEAPAGATSFSQPTSGTTVRGVFGGSAGGHGEAGGGAGE
jgi:hypothetical protein